MSSPCLKLFLSIDISGSATYKNEANLQKLHTRIRQRQELFEAIHATLVSTEHKHINIPKDQASELKTLIDQSLYTKIPSEEADWEETLQITFSTFHNTFRDYLNLNNSKTEEGTYNLWKALGDEIIYVCNVESKIEIHRLVSAFSLALRRLDKKLKETGNLRLKGTAWVANFPVRNRIVYFPFPKTDKTPFPREDYSGPDIDIGFRIGKEAWPGFLTLTMDLVTLLGNADTKLQINVSHVGWKKLKGVWEEREYPIFWAKAHPTYISKDNLDYTEYTQAELAVNPYLQKISVLTEAKEQLESINRIRVELPKELGVIPPYVPPEEDVPEIHVTLSKIHKDIKEARRKQIIEDDGSKNTSELKTDREQIDSIIEKE